MSAATDLHTLKCSREHTCCACGIRIDAGSMIVIIDRTSRRVVHLSCELRSRRALRWSATS